MTSPAITEASIVQLVDTFYARVGDDAVLSPVFEAKLAGRRVEMGSASDKMDIGAARSEPCAEIAADAAGSHHDDFHYAPLIERTCPRRASPRSRRL